MHLLSQDGRKDSRLGAFRSQKILAPEKEAAPKTRNGSAVKDDGLVDLAGLKRCFVRRIEGGPGIEVYGPQGLDMKAEFQLLHLCDKCVMLGTAPKFGVTNNRGTNPLQRYP